MAVTGVRQVDFVKSLDWPKAKASEVFHGTVRYNRDLVNQVADVLRIEPYELLMPPALANGIRRMRADALRIVSDRDLEESEERAERPAARLFNVSSEDEHAYQHNPDPLHHAARRDAERLDADPQVTRISKHRGARHGQGAEEGGKVIPKAGRNKR